MKTEFKDFSNQMMYIHKFIERYTNLDKKCQYCGKPGQIRYSRTEPYDVQFICKKCKIEKNLNDAKNRGLVPDLEVIHIQDYIVDRNVLSKIPKLNKQHIETIQNLLKTKSPKGEAIRSTGWSNASFNRILNLYEKQVDPDIKHKLNDLFIRNRAAKIRLSSMNTNKGQNSTNNLTNIKLRRNLSNSDIVRLANGQIKNNALSLICTGKSYPVVKTKCVLAEALKVSVADIFPHDWLYNSVYNYEDYLKLNNTIRNQVKEFIDAKKKNGEKKVTKKVAALFNMTVYRLYEFVNNHVNLNHEELVSIVSAINL